MRTVTRETRISEQRKRELIVGTLNSICKHGYLNSTINTISEESGLSRGLINHYFVSKDDLITAAHRYYLQNADDFYRHMANTIEDRFDRLFYAACGPFLRNLGYEELLIHYMSAAWMVPDIRALHQELWGKYRAYIGRRLAAVAHEKGMEIDIRMSAITLTQLSDGLWVGKVMEEAFTSDECCTIIRKWLCDLFDENPDDHPLRPDIDLENIETSAPLPKRLKT